MIPESNVPVLLNLGVNLSDGLRIIIQYSKQTAIMGFTLYQWAWSWVVIVLGLEVWRFFMSRMAPGLYTSPSLSSRQEAILEEWEEEARATAWAQDQEDAETKEFLEGQIDFTPETIEENELRRFDRGESIDGYSERYKK